MYYKNRAYKNKIHWKCCEYDKKGCRAACITLDDQLLSHSGDHSHSPNICNVKARQICGRIKEITSRTTQTPVEIIVESISGQTEEAVSSLPNILSLKRSIQRLRRTINDLPREPSSFAEIAIPENSIRTLSDSAFLLFDNQDFNERILIFATESSFNLLSQSSEWFCDGTFKTAPLLFTQLYSIHITINRKMVPVVYCLLPNKTQASYTKMLLYLFQLKPSLRPSRVMLDFELGAIRSFRLQFPNVTINGCYFHLCQSIFRKIQQYSEILSLYRTNEEFCVNIKMIAALSFVPIADIVEAFEALQASPYFQDTSQHVDPILEYFEDTYIGRIGANNQRRSPMFSHEIWNVYIATLNDQARTNNSVEGWHNGFSKIVQSSNPSFYKFIEYLKIDESHYSLVILQALSGHGFDHSRRIYKDLNERLQRVVSTYSREDILRYLRLIAYNLNL